MVVAFMNIRCVCLCVLPLATSVESELVEQLLTAFKNKTPEKELAILLDTSVLESFPELFHNRGGSYLISCCDGVGLFANSDGGKKS